MNQYEIDPEAGVRTPEEAASSEALPGRTAIAGYCRICGAALTAETRREAGGTLYCPIHAPAEPPASPLAAPYPPPPPQPDPSSNVSPGLAFVLGIIPGVGAIYNEQYAKGVIHVLILGFLISLTDGGGSVEIIAGLMIALFFFYMPFEAYHTARRRQRGQNVDELSGLLPGHGGGKASAAGPILLIVLGVLFLADTLNLFDLDQLLRFWPLALIGAGIYWLSSIHSSKRSGEGKP